MSHTTILTTQGLDIGYAPFRRQRHVVVHDIELKLQAGELVCLIGPNGAGKSTLLRTLAGIQAPLAGQVLLHGQPIHRMDARALAQHLSLVFTERINVGILSAYALVALGRYPYTGWSGKLTETDEAVVRWAIEAVGAAPLAHRNVSELSDGERQKVLIARALAQEPTLMILDEPTAFLDLPHRVETMRILRTLARESGRAVLLSTHDLDLALRNADRIWLLPTGGPLHVGAPEDLVLNGAFEAAFHSEGVVFDVRSGSFRVHTRPAGQIALIGDGIQAIWTARALIRAGFDVLEGDGGAAVQVVVEMRSGRPRWQLRYGGDVREHESLYDLVSFLRQNPLPNERQPLAQSRNGY